MSLKQHLSYLKPYCLALLPLLTGCSTQPVKGMDIPKVTKEPQPMAPRLCRKDLHTDTRTRAIIQNAGIYKQIIANSLKKDRSYYDDFLGFVIEKDAKRIYFVYDADFSKIDLVKAMYEPVNQYAIITMRSCGNKKTREEEKESTTAFLKSLGAGFLSAAQSVGYSAAFDGFVFHIRSNHPNTQLLKQKIKQEFGDKVLIRYDDTNKVNL